MQERLRGEHYFSRDYRAARERFRAAAAAKGAALDALPLEARGPADEPLSIDIAWFGSKRPEKALVHTSGMHGVEAFTGSAVQLALLDTLPAVDERTALVLVHVLNPFGMAWLRRTNEHNVDLNRNFLVAGESWSGAPELYRVLDPLLNPPSAPSRDHFGLRAIGVTLKYGFGRVKQAIAEGQYEFPRGLFLGGRELEEGPRRYVEWLAQKLGAARYVLALDLHTGLGKHGRDTVIAGPNATPAGTLGKALTRHLTATTRENAAYTVRGGYGGALPRVLPRTEIDFVLQEIGTYPPVTVLHALREENRCHFHGGAAADDPAKSRLREALCPAAVDWRRRAVALGVELAHSAARFAFSSRTAS